MSGTCVPLNVLFIQEKDHIIDDFRMSNSLFFKLCFDFLPHVQNDLCSFSIKPSINSEQMEYRMRSIYQLAHADVAVHPSVQRHVPMLNRIVLHACLS